YLLNRRSREDTGKAIEYLLHALEMDPSFALGWAELGAAYTEQANFGWSAVVEGYARARQATERALALEPDLAEAHAQMGWIRMFHDWDWNGAETSLGRALELAPGKALVLLRAGTLAYNRGRLDEAV